MATFKLCYKCFIPCVLRNYMSIRGYLDKIALPKVGFYEPAKTIYGKPNSYYNK